MRGSMPTGNGTIGLTADPRPHPHPEPTPRGGRPADGSWPKANGHRARLPADCERAGRLDPGLFPFGAGRAWSQGLEGRWRTAGAPVFAVLTMAIAVDLAVTHLGAPTLMPGETPAAATCVHGVRLAAGRLKAWWAGRDGSRLPLSRPPWRRPTWPLALTAALSFLSPLSESRP